MLSKPALAPVPRQIGALTSIRGVAAWWIVLFHFREALPAATPESLLTLADHGYLAVDLFFPLSGFVIGLNYAEKLLPLKISSYGTFLWLRIARIYPLHLFMLCLYMANPLAIWLFSAQQSSEGRYDPAYFLLSLFLVQNWGFSDSLEWNVPAWSISTEWMAYLLVPLPIIILHSLGRGLVVACLSALLPLLALAILAAQLHVGLGTDITHFGPVRCVLEFWAGIGLFTVYRLRLGSGRLDAPLAAALSLLCLGGYCYLGWSDYAAAPIGFLLLIYALCRCGGFVERVMNDRRLLYIGAISYSTYMAHYFIRDWVKFLLVGDEYPSVVPLAVYLGLTACLSTLLYHFIEVPGRRLLRNVTALERDSFW